ncbi:phage holin family protein [Roseibium sp. RKSG952]|uniref:phage holin family protein n=1 Tax=Roseibium sp. RKSG952 TaxID=2529384 RepID=UPI0012BD6448|nr:phage holin family protein [Roseibium sp. RKSG952]MTI01017.1 phage holin family protein [Roseibium sp. RKSG952]
MSYSLRKEISRSTRRIGRNANIAFRAEKTISRRRFAVLRMQTGMLAAAGLLAGIGIIMLNVAVFFVIAEHVGNANAGLILAAGDFVIAVILVMVAMRMTAESELEPLVEVRDIAIADIEADLEEAFDELTDIADGVRQIIRDPLGALMGGLAGPLLAALFRSVNSDNQKDKGENGSQA